MADIKDSSPETELWNYLADAMNRLDEVRPQEKEIENKKESIRDMFNHMHELFKEYEGRREEHDKMMDLKSQMSDLAREVGDIVERHDAVNAANQGNHVRKSYLTKFKKESMDNDVREKIRQLEKRIAYIYPHRGKSYIRPMDAFNDEARELQIKFDLEMEKSWWKSVEVDGAVGLDDEAKTLVKLLVEGENDLDDEVSTWLDQLYSGREDLDVISISGMGGLGKTTLAVKVFKECQATGHFQRCACVRVSQEYELKKLLLGILGQITEEITIEEFSRMTEQQLKQEVEKQLSQTRYLVVLDDVWQKNHWDDINGVLPDNKMGRRILVTTRNTQVARHASRNRDPHEVRFLREDECRKVFDKRVSKGGQSRWRPKDLTRTRKMVIDKSGGLPLAIVTLCDLLTRRENDKSVLDDFSTRIEEENPCLEILALSYRDLPQHLRPCFLYLSLFPQGHVIRSTQLIQLWISEGFIVPDKDQETAAKGYLDLLVQRNLIQVEKRSSDGGVKTCRLHHLIHALCLKLSKKEKFLDIRQPRDGNSHSLQASPRWLSVRCAFKNYIKNADPSKTPDVRTLLCFEKDDIPNFKEEHWNLDGFKFLRVLDLGDNEVVSLPDNIDKLILLRYLRVKLSSPDGVPNSMPALQNLLTLDLRRSGKVDLPKTIWSLKRLRHLLLDGPCKLPKVEVGKNSLSDLHTICYISHYPGTNIAGIAPNLRKLGLLDPRFGSRDEESIFKLNCLETLKFRGESFFMRTKLPESITKITVKETGLEAEKIILFGKLPNIKILKIEETCFEDDALEFEEGCFPELQTLKIKSSSIVSWTIAQGAVPKLEWVVISKCSNLDVIPKELFQMNTLRKLELFGLPKEITKAYDKFNKSNQQPEVVISPREP